MANIIYLASAICFLSLFSLTYGAAEFTVEGKVYCDTCRVQFITKATTYIKGATVRLQCLNRTGEVPTYKSAEAVTDATGTYRIKVEGEHGEDELCEVVLVKSPDPECSEIHKDPFVKEAADITLTNENGISDNVRQANPVGFLKKQALPQCKEILRGMGIAPSGLVH